MRDLPVARIAADHPGAAATASRTAICRHRAMSRSLSPRAACASGRCRPTARTTLPNLSLDFERRRRQRPASRFISVEPPSHAPPNRARLTRRRKPACQRTCIRTRLRRRRTCSSAHCSSTIPTWPTRRRCQPSPTCRSRVTAAWYPILRGRIRVRQAHHREFRLRDQWRIPVADPAGHEDHQRLGATSSGTLKYKPYVNAEHEFMMSVGVHTQLRAHRCNRHERRDARQ